ncbi:MAG: MazF family transcriptional regulator [Anaerolinea sp.]|nr:MazF family transcriptional regulator [Anaerolinea sp.]
MRRGELYRVHWPDGDAKRDRVYLVVSREEFLQRVFSSVVCVPVYSRAIGLSTEVPVGPMEGLKHESVLRCDVLTSVGRHVLTQYVGFISSEKMRAVNRAMASALDIDGRDLR